MTSFSDRQTELKGERRERQRRKRRYGMQVSGRSIKTVLLQILAKKAREARG